MSTTVSVNQDAVYRHEHALQTPAHISCLTLTGSGLLAGSDDGSLRLYDLTSLKVLKAVRALAGEVSSAVNVRRTAQQGDVWLACGRQILLYRLDSPKLVQTFADAATVLDIGEDDDDVVNEITVNSNASYLAFSTDSGTVGVVDLATKKITRMKTRHNSICGTVNFAPDRPREIISGGYDHAILHFDYQQGTILSRQDIPASTPDSGITLSPPFIMCSAISPSGIFAAGTADGRLWVGLGGEKRPEVAKKKTRKWEGLRDDEIICEKIAEGPIVAMSFSDAETLALSTLLGSIMQIWLSRDASDKPQSSILYRGTVKSIQKVNALVSSEEQIIVGGFAGDGKGIIEIWKRNSDNEVVP